MAAAKDWCFTLNNYSDEEYDAMMAKYDDERSQIRYIVVGKEGGENGTPHLQGFKQMNIRKRLAQIKEIVGQRTHLEKRRGKPQKAADYCKKDGNWEQKGKITVAGQRNDLTLMARQMLEGMSAIELLDNHEDNYIRNAKAVENIVMKLKHDISVKRMKERLENVQLRDWQQRVYAILSSDEVHPRRVYWFGTRQETRGSTSWPRTVRQH